MLLDLEEFSVNRTSLGMEHLCGPNFLPLLEDIPLLICEVSIFSNKTTQKLVPTRTSQAQAQRASRQLRRSTRNGQAT